MTSNKGAFYMIAMSVIIAATMLYSGQYIDPDNSQTVTYLLISLWLILAGIIRSLTKSK